MVTNLGIKKGCLMKIKLLVLCCSLFLHQTYPMNSGLGSSKTKDFSTPDALEKSYDELLPYLYSACDAYTPQESFIWCDTELKKGSPFAFYFIEEKAKKACVVCCYMMIRNLTQKCSAVLQDEKYLENYEFETPYIKNKYLNDLLFYMVLCLLRVGANIGTHYCIFKNQDVFKAYTILKSKFKLFLTTYLTSSKLDQHPLYPETKYLLPEAVRYWNSLKDKTILLKDCNWVAYFNWTNPNLLGSYGITFSKVLEKKEIELELSEISEINNFALSIFSIVIHDGNYTQITSRYKTWADFFADDDKLMKKNFLELGKKINNHKK